MADSRFRCKFCERQLLLAAAEQAAEQAADH